MEEENKWTLLASILPGGIELNELSEDECEVTDGENTIKVISNDTSYVVNGRTISFEDTDPEIINTLVVPFIMQELDGNKRF